MCKPSCVKSSTVDGTNLGRVLEYFSEVGCEVWGQSVYPFSSETLFCRCYLVARPPPPGGGSRPRGGGATT